MSDLVGTQIVCFLTHRLIWHFVFGLFVFWLRTNTELEIRLTKLSCAFIGKTFGYLNFQSLREINQECDNKNQQYEKIISSLKYICSRRLITYICYKFS